MCSKNFLFFVYLSFLINVPFKALAQESEKNSEERFAVDEAVSVKIYNESRSAISSASTAPMRVDSSFRIFFPAELSLVNKYFEVPYSENANTIMGINVGPYIPLYANNRYSLDSFMRIGYAYSQGIYDVRAESGIDVRDAVELQWIPAQAGIEILSAPILSGWMQIGGFTSAGIDWFTQGGQLDGMNQTFWVPRLELGSSVTILDGSSRGSVAKNVGGFEGIRFSGATYRSFASKQKNTGWAADIGARYAF
jgi:hypothetical protein